MSRWDVVTTFMPVPWENEDNRGSDRTHHTQNTEELVFTPTEEMGDGWEVVSSGFVVLTTESRDRQGDVRWRSKTLNQYVTWKRKRVES